jgi:hypothetical protein
MNPHAHKVNTNSRKKLQWVVKKSGLSHDQSTHTSNSSSSSLDDARISANWLMGYVDFFALLPKDLIFHVIEYLHAKEIGLLCRVNKWYGAAC